MCDICNVRFMGTATPFYGKYGWICAIRHDKENDWWSIIINHNGDQQEIPIAYCPECGRELR